MPESAGIAKSLRRTLDLEVLPGNVAPRAPGPAILLNPRRLEIVLTAAVYPGIHLRSAARLLLSSLPTIRHHVQVLESAGTLRTVPRGRRLHLFVPGLFSPREETILLIWDDPRDRSVLRAVTGRPGIRRRELSGKIVASPSSLDRSIRRLRDAGVVRDRSGSGVQKLWPTSAWRDFERSSVAGAAARTERFLALLANHGLRPALDRTEGTVARISVDGPRGRVRFAFPANPLRR
ncbi:MAG: hypothetical protein A3K68_06135 [Euryarchaeota archaeon RBG_16_68_13]|nr:MAG: hypothetical protein A3K68_06135 [Euryarchaeota archaeon RBG_16_68_13]